MTESAALVVSGTASVFCADRGGNKKNAQAVSASTTDFNIGSEGMFPMIYAKRLRSATAKRPVPYCRS